MRKVSLFIHKGILDGYGCLYGDCLLMNGLLVESNSSHEYFIRTLEDALESKFSSFLGSSGHVLLNLF